MAEARPLTSLRALRNAVRYDIFPLLEEYCSESPTALAELLGDGLYDAESSRFRDELMATGREADFVKALTVWDPQRLGALGKTMALADRLTIGECRHGLTLRARQHVGVVQLGPIRVSIRPKMSVADRLDASGPGLKSVPTPRPDLIARHRQTGRAVGVYDMKYRDLWATSVPRDILYQLSTYALAVDSHAPSVVLYPAASGVNPDMKLAIQVVGGRERSVVFRAIDWSTAARLVASRDAERAGALAHRWLVGA